MLQLSQNMAVSKQMFRVTVNFQIEKNPIPSYIKWPQWTCKDGTPKTFRKGQRILGNLRMLSFSPVVTKAAILHCFLGFFFLDLCQDY